MAFIQRFSSITRGGIVFIGISKLTNANQPGIQGSIGAFTSLNNGLVVNNFPAGTTLNYLQNASSAILLNFSLIFVEIN